MQRAAQHLKAGHLARAVQSDFALAVNLPVVTGLLIVLWSPLTCCRGTTCRGLAELLPPALLMLLWAQQHITDPHRPATASEVLCIRGGRGANTLPMPESLQASG